MQLLGTTIEKVLVVDDDPNVREVYGFAIEELGLTPIFEKGPLENVQQAIMDLKGKADSIVCDYHLRKRNYSRFNGDDLVVESYKTRIPSLLCTTYTDFDITLLRGKRRYIPGLIKPDDLNPDTIRKSFSRCILENQGTFEPSRKPWRSLVRVEEVVPDEKYFYGIIPGWNAEEKIRIYFDDLPSSLHEAILEGKRLHSFVNIGAEREEELFFERWEAA